MAFEDRSATEGTSTAASRARVARLQETDTGLGTACAGVEADRLAVRARLSRLRTIAARGPEAWVHEPIESEALEALRHAVVDCETRLAAARAIYLERHPKLIALEKERADLLSKMREEVPRAITALEGQESVLAAREEQRQHGAARPSAHDAARGLLDGADFFDSWFRENGDGDVHWFNRLKCGISGSRVEASLS